MSKAASRFQQWERQYADDPEYVTYGLLYEITNDICKAMERQGMTRRELARRLGVTPQYVGRFLNTPANTSLQQIVRFAQAVGLEVKVDANPKIVATLKPPDPERRADEWSERALRSAMSQREPQEGGEEQVDDRTLAA